MRDYFDNRWHTNTIGPDDRVLTPTAMAVFANEFVPEGEPPRELFERLYDIARWTVFPSGGHFAASEEPVVIIARTRKGHGVEFMEKQPQAWHLGLLNSEQYADVVAEISARMELANG